MTSTVINMNFVISVFTAILVGAVNSQGFVDNVCTLQSTGLPGVCKLFVDCQKAREELKQSRFPQTCGFQGTQPIVCCPQNQAVTTETTTTTTTTTTQSASQDRRPGDISKRKCREYSRYVFETKLPPIPLVDVTAVTTNECGHKVVKLIVGGEPAGRKEFPHMAAVGYEPTPGNFLWLCGGTIISNRFILTAAHCLSDINWGDALWVRIGASTLSNPNHRQEIKIAERIAHPEYRSNSHYHDIGLLKLEKRATLNPYSRPACLYLKPDISAQKAIATGWGRTSYDGELSDNLLKVTIDLFSQSTCGSIYQTQRKIKQGILNDLQVCAGALNEKNDTCQGDSGGPLQIYHTGDKIKCMYDIIGVTSFGKGCGESLGVYVRISHYIKWIEDVVWP